MYVTKKQIYENEYRSKFKCGICNTVMILKLYLIFVLSSEHKFYHMIKIL